MDKSSTNNVLGHNTGSISPSTKIRAARVVRDRLQKSINQCSVGKSSTNKVIALGKKRSRISTLKKLQFARVLRDQLQKSVSQPFIVKRIYGASVFYKKKGLFDMIKNLRAVKALCERLQCRTVQKSIIKKSSKVVAHKKRDTLVVAKKFCAITKKKQKPYKSHRSFTRRLKKRRLKRYRTYYRPVRSYKMATRVKTLKKMRAQLMRAWRWEKAKKQQSE